MQADARLVQDVHRSHEAGAQRGHEVDALALAARQGIAGAVEGQVAQAHVHDALQPGDDLGDRLGHDVPLRRAQRQVAEEVERLLGRHSQDLVDVVPADFDPEGLAAQAGAAAGRARGAAAEAAEHVFELDLVALALHPGEELVDAEDRRVVALDVFAVPDQVLGLVGEVAIRLEDGDVVAGRDLDQVVLEPAHLIAAPAGDGPVVDALGLVRHHEVLADADDLAQAAAGRAGAQRRIEAEQEFVRLAENDAVPLEAAAEMLQAAVFGGNGDAAVAAREGVGDRREQARARVAGRGARQAGAVQQQPGAGQRVRALLQHVIDLAGPAVRIQAVVAVLLELQKQLHPVRARVPVQVREHVEGPSARTGEPVHHVRHAVAADLLPRYRGIGPPDPGEQQTQEIVDLRGRSHGRTGIAGADLLLDGDRGRNAFDAVHVRFGHPAQELPGIGREALGETPLPLGI